MPRLGGKLCAEANNHVKAWSGANYVAVISNTDFESIRISDSKTFKAFHAVSENVRCFAQGPEFPGIRGQAICSQWRTGSVRHDWDFAINLLLPFRAGFRFRFPLHFSFYMCSSDYRIPFGSSHLVVHRAFASALSPCRASKSIRENLKRARLRLTRCESEWLQKPLQLHHAQA